MPARKSSPQVNSQLSGNQREGENTISYKIPGAHLKRTKQLVRSIAMPLLAPLLLKQMPCPCHIL